MIFTSVNTYRNPALNMLKSISSQMSGIRGQLEKKKPKNPQDKPKSKPPNPNPALCTGSHTQTQKPARAVSASLCKSKAVKAPGQTSPVTPHFTINQCLCDCMCRDTHLPCPAGNRDELSPGYPPGLFLGDRAALSPWERQVSCREMLLEDME